MIADIDSEVKFTRSLIGKSALDQCSDEIERQGRMFVSGDQTLRVGPPGLGSEFRRVDQIARFAHRGRRRR